MSHRNTPKPLSPARPAACPESLHKARPAKRRRFVFTPARRAALDAARRKRKFLMTPAKFAALRKATGANQRNFRMTRARRAAMGMNIRKAQAASVRKFRMTPRRAQALRVNIRKAQAAKRTPESRRRSRFNHLQHGLYAQSVEKTLARLGESPEKFRAFAARLEHAFGAQSLPERRAARHLAETLWQRLRLFRAKERWETKAFDRICNFGDAVPSREPGHLRALGLLIMEAILVQPGIDQMEKRLINLVERRIRAYIRLVVGGDPKFKIFTHDVRRLMDRDEHLRREIEKTQGLMEWGKLLRAGDPVAEKAFRDTVAQLEKARISPAAILRW